MPRYHEIISYPEMVQREGLALQKGMNFRIKSGTAGYSIILMSVRKGAPYQDQWHESGPHAGMLEYEGHDVPNVRGSRSDPKTIDQPMKHQGGGLTENGKFYHAALAAQSGEQEPEVVQVYEKIASGIWSDRGRYLLVDAEIKTVPATSKTRSGRKVFRFYLSPTTTPNARTRGDLRELTISRQIPTSVKVAVWKRDHGCCVQCGATDNLHFDHDLPFSKGGSSITEANVKLLCARHNLSKSDKILSIGPWVGALIAAATMSASHGS